MNCSSGRPPLPPRPNDTGPEDETLGVVWIGAGYHVEAWARRYAEKHPELFIPRFSEASEGDDHTEAMGAQRHLSFLDYNEPLVLEKHLEHLEKFFETGQTAARLAGRGRGDLGKERK